MGDTKTPALDYALEKTSFIDFSKLRNAASNVSMGQAKDVVRTLSLGTAAGSLAFMTLNNIKQKIQNDTRRKALIEDLYMNDPIIREADREDVLQYYATVMSVAPSISLDKNVVKELLQNFIKFGRVDIQTIKTLADTEKSISGSKSDGFKVSDAVKLIGVGTK